MGERAPAAESVADLLRHAASSATVGRERERARLAELLAPGAPAVVVVHGPGGIGKSTLVAAAVHGRPTVWIDARHVEPTPAAVLAALAAHLGPGAADAGVESVAAAIARARIDVVVVDSYERFAVVDGWLRRELVPRLPASTTTVLVSRSGPNVAWKATPGWRHLVAELLVGPLTEQDAAELVERRAVDARARERVLKFGRGHPLALELALEAFARRPALELHDGPPPEVVEELVDVILDDLGPRERAVVEATSVLRRVTEPLLQAVLHEQVDVDAAWRTLRALPFVHVGPAGLELNAVVQDVVAGDLELRAPGRARELRRRAAHAAVVEIEAAPGWASTADLLHLVQNPVVRNAFVPPPGLEHPVEQARAADGDAIAALLAEVEDPAHAEVLARWWRVHPAAFSVLRGPAGEVRAVSVVRAVDLVDTELAAVDPVAAAVVADLRDLPLLPGGRALLHRRALARGTGEALTAELAPMIVDIKRTYLEMRPALQRVYAVVRDWPAQERMLVAMGFAPRSPAVRVGGCSLTLCALDFGPRSVDGWLAHHVAVETDARGSEGREVRTTPVVAAASDLVAQLSAREREVLAALADGLTNRELAERLFISERTANRHLSNIFTKLGVRNRTEAARMAIDSGVA